MRLCVSQDGQVNTFCFCFVCLGKGPSVRVKGCQVKRFLTGKGTVIAKRITKSIVVARTRAAHAC